LPEPTIIDKPFTSIRAMLDNIVDIDDQEHFKGVKQRLEIVKGQVDEAIQQFEQGKIETSGKSQAKAESDLLQKEIIDLMIKEDYQPDTINRIAANATGLNDAGVNSLLADLYNNWGVDLGGLAATKSGDEADALYREAFAKYQQAVGIKPDLHEAYNNWGTHLGKLAATQSGDEADALYREAFAKYQQAVGIKPDKHEAYYNWGTYLGNLATTKSGDEADALYREAFAKYQQAVGIKQDLHEAYYNWGNHLGNLAATKSGDEAEALYRQAFDKFQKAVELKPDDHEAYYSWGTVLLNLAKTQAGGDAEALYRQALEKCQKAVDLGGKCYNLACTYALMQDKDNALLYLNRSLENKEENIEFVTDDTDWAGFLDDENFKAVINRYAKL